MSEVTIENLRVRQSLPLEAKTIWGVEKFLTI